MDDVKAITRYSTMLCFSVLLLLLIVSPVSADDESPWPEEYTILCASEERTGFNWRNGKWKPVQFKNVKRLIVKPLIPDLGCQIWKGEPEHDSHESGSNEGFAWVYDATTVCINVRRLGDKYYPHQSRNCTQLYEKNISNPDGFSAIFCNDPPMNLKPNGWYHYANIHSLLDDAPEDGRKDSQYIEVGKCSMIKP